MRDVKIVLPIHVIVLEIVHLLVIARVVVVDPVVKVPLELTVLLVDPRVLEVVDHHVHRFVEITDVLAVVDPHVVDLVELNVL